MSAGMPGIIASLTMVAVWSQMTLAMGQGAPATDNELYAGYCLGVSETQPALLALLALPRPLTPPGTENTPSNRELAQRLKESDRLIKQFYQQQQQRLASYLMSRGVLLPEERVGAFL